MMCGCLVSLMSQYIDGGSTYGSLKRLDLVGYDIWDLNKPRKHNSVKQLGPSNRE